MKKSKTSDTNSEYWTAIELARAAHKRVMAVVRTPGVTQESVDAVALQELVDMFKAGMKWRSQ